jgi:sugar/nucleoside kinase (ribokinase family)
MIPSYDLFCFGNLSLDIIKTPTSYKEMMGGAILYGVWVGHQLGYDIGVLTKTAKKDKDGLKELPFNSHRLTWVESTNTTSILNNYLTADMERRVCTNLGQADPFKITDFPEFNAKVIMHEGLLADEIDLSLIQALSKKAKLAVDAQGLIRKVMPNGDMEFAEWPDFKLALPYIYYFKADAAEAEFLTGIKTDTREGRIEAGKLFRQWGAKEVVISHNSELLSISDEGIVTAPFRNRKNDGRTGRGDTCFVSYITTRFLQPADEAILFAAALTSLKVEIPGPFKKTREDVLAFMKEYY